MYAVFEDRNQQFRATTGARLCVPLLQDLEPGKKVTFDKVCLITGDKSKIGTPYVKGAKVTATVLGTVKGPKLTVQKLRRRKNSRRRTGFRARYTEVQIDAIEGA
jgi:large subunit ribosomal protein L21